MHKLLGQPKKAPLHIRAVKQKRMSMQIFSV
jgi:hypothetical protein